MTAFDPPQQFAAELGVWSQVLEFLPLPRLLELRNWLKLPAQVELLEDRTPLSVLRADVLTATCRRLVDEFGWPESHLIDLATCRPTHPTTRHRLPTSEATDALRLEQFQRDQGRPLRGGRRSGRKPR